MNVLIVEGKDDVAFIKYLIQYIGIEAVEINTFTIDELGGFSAHYYPQLALNVDNSQFFLKSLL